MKKPGDNTSTGIFFYEFIHVLKPAIEAKFPITL